MHKHCNERLIGMCKECKQYETFDELPQELKDKFKYSGTNKSAITKTKNCYVDFINLLNKDGNELVSDYVKVQEYVSIRWGECGHITPIKPNWYKNGQRCGNKECVAKRISQSKIEDLTGQRFGRLTVVSLCEEQTGGHAKWNCLCDCGNTTIGGSGDLKVGLKKSCGCLHHDMMIERNTSDKQRQAVKDAWATDDGTRLQQIQQLGYDSKGENNPMYKGGITPITYYLRNYTKQWDKNVRQYYNKKCVLTCVKCTTRNSAVHHLHGFNMIVEEAHVVNNIEVKPQAKDYTKEELQLLENYILEWHKDTSNGVLLCNEVHKLFHSLYGKGNNTPKQFEEFKERYFNGDFNKDNTEVTKGIKEPLVP